MKEARVVQKITILFVGTVLLLCLTAWGPFDWFFTRPIIPPKGSERWVEEEIEHIRAQAANIDINVLKLGLVAYINAKHHGIAQKDLLTIIDYSKSSALRRLWVIDLKNDKVLFNTWVSHGKNSGLTQATSFSNKPGSLKSSIGVFRTLSEPYMGSNGYSLRLAGLENGFNDKALQRYIVFHGAWYAHPDTIKKHGYLGRSWGCPAVGLDTVRPLINTIKDNSIVVVYYPDRKWINNSTFLVGRG